MRKASGLSVSRGGVLPILPAILVAILVAVLAGGLGHMRANARRGVFFEATSSLSGVERTAVESAAALAVANATWAFGSEESVRKMMRSELDRIAESEGAQRARVFVRFGIIDSNPDGQAAVFSQACVADPRVCDHNDLKTAAEREARARFVPPGNHLPLFLMGDHPPIPGSHPGPK